MLNKKWVEEIQAIAKNNQCQVSNFDEDSMIVTFSHIQAGHKDFYINGLTPILVKEWISKSIGSLSTTQV